MTKPTPTPATPTGDSVTNPAGGVPMWTYLAYHSTLRRNGNMFAIITPGGARGMSNEDMAPVLDALNNADLFARERAAVEKALAAWDRCNEHGFGLENASSAIEHLRAVTKGNTP